MIVKSTTRGVRISPRKMSVVAALVRGRTVADALVILSHTERRSALPISKAIKSVKANAEYNHNLKPNTLTIKTITINHGQSLKRYNPAAHGRALPFLRRSSHIFIEVEGEERPAKKPVEKTENDDNSKKETK